MADIDARTAVVYVLGFRHHTRSSPTRNLVGPLKSQAVG